MVDFNTSQLTWIVIGACSVGGTGYLSMDGSIKEMNTKVEIITVKAQESEKRLAALQEQLTRIEDKLDRK